VEESYKEDNVFSSKKILSTLIMQELAMPQDLLFLSALSALSYSVMSIIFSFMPR
jgi:hypothetical protein